MEAMQRQSPWLSSQGNTALEDPACSGCPFREPNLLLEPRRGGNAQLPRIQESDGHCTECVSRVQLVKIKGGLILIQL